MELSGKKIAILAKPSSKCRAIHSKRPARRLKSFRFRPAKSKAGTKKIGVAPVKVDKTLGEASASDYDAIVLPGGQINPDLLRVGAHGSQIHQG
jgi:protease I